MFNLIKSCSLSKLLGTTIKVVAIRSETIVEKIVSDFPVPVGKTIVAGSLETTQ